MPLPNRVAPDGELIAAPARGLLMGNRGGRFHDPATRRLGARRWAGRAWICCLLSFKSRVSPGVWGPHRYTELFFCDEVTALAAGHRPCMECRRADALAWREAMVQGLGLPEAPRFPEIDLRLHAERLSGRAKQVHRMDAADVPDGAVVQSGPATFLAFRGDDALRWSPHGYAERAPRPTGVISVLTPPSSIAALRSGYAPLWHPSADLLAR